MVVLLISADQDAANDTPAINRGCIRNYHVEHTTYLVHFIVEVYKFL